MVSVGELIWLAVRPLLRLAIITASGFIATRLDMFPPVAARAAGQIMLTILYPALLFSKIVPAFSQENLPALGPLVLVATIYQALGILFAWIIRYLCWTPYRFRHGILVAGGWGNIGDIPAAVITAVTASAPFAGPRDENLSIAYISAFIVYNTITLFPCGGHHWISQDFGGPDVENDEMRRAAKLRRRALFVRLGGVFRRLQANHDGDLEGTRQDVGNTSPATAGTAEPLDRPPSSELQQRKPAPSQLTVPVTWTSSDFNNPAPLATVRSSSDPTPLSSPDSINSESRSVSTSPDHEKAAPQHGQSQGVTVHDPPIDLSSPSPDRRRTNSTKVLSRLKTFLNGFLLPISIVVLAAFAIALIPALKGLFVPINGENRYPPAPDGQPPLAFIMDAATFAGAGAVPLGLISLGSALARLKVPSWTRAEMSKLPLASISWLAVMKMVVSPVLGLLICQGLTRVGVIDERDKVLRFVCIFYSCLPTFTTQVMLTQVYSGTGEAEHLPAYLIPQYALMFLSLTALTAYTLHILF